VKFLKTKLSILTKNETMAPQPTGCILAELDTNIKFCTNPFSQREDVSFIPNKKKTKGNTSDHETLKSIE
jgi:hypothetical protein